ncbi:hypothetical protein Bbelb_055470 [Branchiostoma belcheri]|nr:hypothetical protein Bbelb_055470 [Branchiostoma belcheri]
MSSTEDQPGRVTQREKAEIRHRGRSRSPKVNHTDREFVAESPAAETDDHSDVKVYLSVDGSPSNTCTDDPDSHLYHYPDRDDINKLQQAAGRGDQGQQPPDTGDDSTSPKTAGQSTSRTGLVKNDMYVPAALQDQEKGCVDGSCLCRVIGYAVLMATLFGAGVCIAMYFTATMEKNTAKEQVHATHSSAWGTEASIKAAELPLETPMPSPSAGPLMTIASLEPMTSALPETTTTTLPKTETTLPEVDAPLKEATATLSEAEATPPEMVTSLKEATATLSEAEATPPEMVTSLKEATATLSEAPLRKASATLPEVARATSEATTTPQEVTTTVLGDNNEANTMTLPQMTVTKKTALRCQTGYKFVAGACIRLYLERKDHGRAQWACKSDGATLAMPKTEELDVALRDLINSVDDYYGKGYWIGLGEEYSTWYWLDGTPLRNHYQVC